MRLVTWVMGLALASPVAAQDTTALYLCPVEMTTSGPSRQTTRCRGEGTQTSSIVSVPMVNWALTAVTTSPAQHLAFEADGSITAFAAKGVTGLTFDLALGPAARNVLASEFEARRIPAQWITETTSAREAVRVLARILLLMQMFPPGDYPAMALDDAMTTLTLDHRQRLRAWMADRNVDRSLAGVSCRAWLQHLHDTLVWPTIHLGPITLD